MYLAVAAPILSILFLSSVWRGHIRQLRLEDPDEFRTLPGRIAALARRYSFARIWYLEIISLTFVAAGLLVLVNDPAKWPLGTVAIAFFGLGAVLFARTLIVKRG